MGKEITTVTVVAERNNSTEVDVFRRALNIWL